MAIDPKELRIGSHVNANGVRAKVIDIHNKLLRPDCKYQIFVEGISPEDGEKKVVGSMVDDLQPIPITPELLTELEFEYFGTAYGEKWARGRFEIERKRYSKYFDYDSQIRLESLHELENLYYMIYGVELIND